MQVAHSMHASVILYLPPSAIIASLGHSSLHVPQAMHWSVIINDIKPSLNSWIPAFAGMTTFFNPSPTLGRGAGGEG